MSIYVPFTSQVHHSHRLAPEDLIKADRQVLAAFSDVPGTGTSAGTAPAWDRTLLTSGGTYALDVVAGQLVDFEISAALGPWLFLYDADGFPINEKEGTHTTGLNTARMGFLAEQTGRIYIKAAGYPSTLLGRVDLTVRIDDQAHGTAGNDVHVQRASGGGADGYLGGDGNDSITSSLPNIDNKLCGGAGNDVMSVGFVAGERAIVDGGSGIDTLVLPVSSGGVRINAVAAGFHSTEQWHYNWNTLSSHPQIKFSGIEFIRFTDITVSLADLPGYSQYMRDSADGNDIRGDNAPNYIKVDLGDDQLAGYGGTDSLVAGHGNDSLYGGGGDDILAGEAGNDTALFHGKVSGFRIISNHGHYMIVDTTGAEGSDILFDVERATFANHSTALEYAGLTQSLYYSYFGRAADVAGLASFQQRLVELKAPQTIEGLNAAYVGSAPLRTLIDSFGSSAESTALYGGDNAAFVKAIFQNVFDRAPLQAGLDYWTQAIDSGALTRANASLAITAGAMANKTPAGLQDAALVTAKVDVATNFTFALDAADKAGAYAGTSAVNAVRELLKGVTADTNVISYQESVTAVVGALQAGPVKSMMEVPADGAYAALVGLHDAAAPAWF
ncbi:DUF4214 domain-containing protein [Massilia pseudoviolaceinigra]|uniref:DUF4214 domain-containing protein n=1 Tax=Massilia pseudoviolaceinigra TaxID=3057165 RepID=UPI0027965EBB|nr:DUF4214 domain-containing protein [Massilia sp. CCM 9206]MDQ1923989.1 DUF4214 domain-containing protein [Massilia sp. CCM 9206]